jgi:hypothetical protein
MGLKPASRLTNINQAIPQNSQQMMIADLRRSRPPLVAYNVTPARGASVGLPLMDGVQTQVRSFLVSQYVLNHWTPVIDADGFLFMLRNDLLQSRPHTPQLSSKPLTKTLYDSQPGCAWGDAADYLPSTPAGASVVLHGQSTLGPDQVGVSGWSFDTQTGKSPRAVVILIGSRVVAVAPVQWSTPTVVAALHRRAAANSGFNYGFTTNQWGPISVYAVTGRRQKELHLLGGAQPGAPHLTHIRVFGKTLPVVPGSIGKLTGAAVSGTKIEKFDVPAQTSLPSYQLATLSASPQPIGTAQLVLSDTGNFDTPIQPLDGYTSPTVEPSNATISATALPVTGDKLSIRVGSCLPWHGYGKPSALYLEQTGGTPITTIKLSGVAG